MLVAGLTGSIATGKSTVSEILKELGAFIIDADRIAREVVVPGMSAWGEIVKEFGTGILLPDKSINREALGRIVFDDPLKRGKLEEIIHPEVIRIMDERISSIKAGSIDAVVVLDVPLLMETGMDRGLQDVILVYCPVDIQIRRLMDRDKITQVDALTRIRSQMSIEEKRQRATLIIDNSGSKDETRRQVVDAYGRLAIKAK
ncbi:MAG TPA: dephospho-CoA kinase [Desulfomonilia bacterium]|nr:dephospho-CoA kinase [Desulfomonilia bacterium]